MPLRTKKWTRSKANQYISRSKACKKLQLSLPSFRKLCILKGIYPHDPKKKHKKEGDRRVYYHAKDIKHLHREPILWQWRSQKTYRNKITKHKGRHNWDKVRRMQLNMPQISIDHLVRERYPTFNHALRDLDDCATFIFLFATLPSGIIPQLTALRRMECQKLCKEFRHYISKHGLLTKAFISVKGIYYQCRFKDKYDITWIVPHNFTHSIPKDVDYRVMSSFLDFYQTMFKFVIFKLYKDSNMRYPPFGHIDYDLTQLSLTKLIAGKFTIKRRINWNKNKKKRRKNENSNKNVMNDECAVQDVADVCDETNKKQRIVRLDLTKILGANSKDLDEELKKENGDLEERYLRREWDRSNLFEDFKFLLNRETPQFELEFIILAMGGSVVFQQDCINNQEITHHIVDRKINESLLLNTREYIQPQWIFDCLNTGTVIPTQHYQIGIQCPPHLSPFVLYNDQSHIPSQHFVLEHWKKVSKQFGGFVPSKKLRKQENIKMEEIKEDIKEENNEEDVAMNLDIADIMDVKEIEEVEVEVEAENDGLNEFVDGDDDEDEEDVEEEESDKLENRESVLQKQRIVIANKERRRSVRKQNKHSLESDGIPGNKEERIKVNLARTMMSKKYRKTYDRIRRNKTKKSKHLKYMDEKRKRFEQKQMHSRH